MVNVNALLKYLSFFHFLNACTLPSNVQKSCYVKAAFIQKDIFVLCQNLLYNSNFYLSKLTRKILHKKSIFIKDLFLSLKNILLIIFQKNLRARMPVIFVETPK